MVGNGEIALRASLAAGRTQMYSGVEVGNAVGSGFSLKIACRLGAKGVQPLETRTFSVNEDVAVAR
jgi:hypothetical protein